MQAEFVRWRWNIGAGRALRSGRAAIDDPGAPCAADRRLARLPPQHDQPARRLRLVLRLDAGAHRRREHSPGAGIDGRGSHHSQSVVPRSVGRRRRSTTRRDPPTRLALADIAELPRWQRASIGIDHQIRQGMRLNLDTFYEHTEQRLPLARSQRAGQRRSSRCRPSAACCSSSRSGASGANGFNVDLSYSPRQGIFSSVRYGFVNNRNDGDDALTPPASGTFETEWAPHARGSRIASTGISACRFRASGVIASINGRWNSGTLYNHHDRARRQRRRDLQRSPGRRRAQHLAGAVDAGDRHARVVDAPVDAPEWQRQSPARRRWRRRRATATGGGGPGPGGRGGQGNNQAQRRFEMYLSVSNLLNRVNKTSYVGVMTSPYFTHATSAQAARRVELGWRFSF